MISQKRCNCLIAYVFLTLLWSVSDTFCGIVSKVGPHCRVAGQRRSPQMEGDLMLRKIDSIEIQNAILKSLNEKRVSKQAVTSCSPMFEWDSSLAEVAQQWADQCALVEYTNNSSSRVPTRYLF